MGKIINTVCKQCQGPVEIYHPERSHSFKCEHCGTFLYWDASKKDIEQDLRRAEMAHEKYMLNRKYRQEDKREERKLEKKRLTTESKKNEHKYSFLKIFIPLLFVFILFFFAIFGNKIIDHPKIKELETIESNLINALNESDFDSANIYLNKMSIFHDLSLDNYIIWEEKQQNYSNLISSKKREYDLSNPDNILAPLSSSEFSKKTGDEAYNLFTKAGFTNIDKISIDGDAGFFKRKNLVDHIEFNGKTEFTTEDYANKNDRIVIYYYSK